MMVVVCGSECVRVSHSLCRFSGDFWVEYERMPYRDLLAQVYRFFR